MGYMRHHAIIVTTYTEEKANKANEMARFYFGHLVTPNVRSIVNGYYSFMIGPDGSKEGWGDSEFGDGARESFKRFLRTHEHEDGSGPYD